MKFDDEYLITDDDLIDTENLPTLVGNPPSCSSERLEKILGDEFLKQAKTKISESDPLRYLQLRGYGFREHFSGFFVYENPNMKKTK